MREICVLRVLPTLVVDRPFFRLIVPRAPFDTGNLRKFSSLLSPWLCQFQPSIIILRMQRIALISNCRLDLPNCRSRVARTTIFFFGSQPTESEHSRATVLQRSSWHWTRPRRGSSGFEFSSPYASPVLALIVALSGVPASYSQSDTFQVPFLRGKFANESRKQSKYAQQTPGRVKRASDNRAVQISRWGSENS